MNEQEINRRIAEYMGLKVRRIEYDNKIAYVLYDSEFACAPLPDYCHDLNAVWKVEEKLLRYNEANDYFYILQDIVNAEYDYDDWGTENISTYGIYQITHATARQRCEAIIKVLEGMDDEV